MFWKVLCFILILDRWEEYSNALYTLITINPIITAVWITFIIYLVAVLLSILVQLKFKEAIEFLFDWWEEFYLW